MAGRQRCQIFRAHIPQHTDIRAFSSARLA